MDLADKIFLAGLLGAIAAVCGVVVWQHPVATWPLWWPWAVLGYALVMGPLCGVAWWLGRLD